MRCSALLQTLDAKKGSPDVPHRLTILRLFAKHASQHTLLPERHGVPRSAEEIWRDAVEEMYRHCKVNNLCEVWAYLCISGM